MTDYTLIALAYNNEARIYVSSATHLVDKARKIHETKPTASAALGRFLTASVMMSLMYKDGERLNLRIVGDGPIEKMVVEANFGKVRATITNPNVYMVYPDGPKKGKLNVGAAVGRGFLHITKDWKGNYFTSSSPLQSGEIGDDFTYYYATSEQTPSAVGLGVLVSKGKKVIAAGGFIIQILPHASEETILTIERIVGGISSITDFLRNQETPEMILSRLANHTEHILEKHDITYHCGCSKKQYGQVLKTLGKDTLTHLLTEDHGAEIICQYCKKKYFFTESDLQKMIHQIS